MTKKNDAATLYYPSLSRVWSSEGEDTWDRGALNIPARGPNGGILHARGFTIHGTLNATVADAVSIGLDGYRFVRALDVKLVDSHMVYNDVAGDAMRDVGYALAGAEMTHEHQDLAIAATTNRHFACYVPFEMPMAFDEDDTSIPVEFIEQIRVKFPIATAFNLGASTGTIHSGSYQLVFDCYEAASVITPALFTVRTFDMAAVDSTERQFSTGGRLQDLLLYNRGASGGGSLANVSTLQIDGLDKEKMTLRQRRHAYARARGAATNLHSTTGNPLTTDPFTAAESGTLRAAALKLSTGSKVTDGPEHLTETVKLELAGSLPAKGTLIARWTVPTSEKLDALVMMNHRVRSFKYKTRDKTMQDPRAWQATPELVSKARYLPKKWSR